MRLSREKVNRLSHLVTDKLAETNEIDFIEDRNTIRLAIVDILMKWLKKEEEIVKAAGQKIEAQKPPIPEGRAGGKFLYRKINTKEMAITNCR